MKNTLAVALQKSQVQVQYRIQLAIEFGFRSLDAAIWRVANQCLDVVAEICWAAREPAIPFEGIAVLICSAFAFSIAAQAGTKQV